MKTIRVRAFALIAATCALLAAPCSAMAATDITGDAKSLSIRLDNASIDEALKSLGGAFDLRYRAPGALNKPLSGTYRGPLREVVKNLLTGYDFVLTTRGGTIEVSVLGKSGKSADVVIERNKAVASKPAVETARPAAATNVQEAMDIGRQNPAPPANDGDAARPMLMAQGDPSKMPMPMPNADGPMPTPIPATGDDLPTPRPDMSGTGPVPMPTPNAEGPVPMPMPANADAPMPTPIPPAPNAQGPMLMPQGNSASPPAAPKPN